MPPKIEAGAQPTPLVLVQIREPPIFQGLPHEDVEDLLDVFDRVSTFIAWNDSTKLAQVYFAVQG